MPIVVSNEGWVKIPQKRSTRPRKPVDPVDVFRGPLAYITGRPEFKEPVRKQSIKQLMIEAASMPAPPPPPSPLIIDAIPMPKQSRSSRQRSRIASEPAPVKSSRSKAHSEIFEEADEEIVRPGLHPEDSQSRRSASPAASRHSRANPSIRSRRHVSSSNPVQDDQDNHRHNRSRRHASSSQSVYSQDQHDDYGHRHRSNRSERSYREPSYRERSRERERYYPHPLSQPHHYSHSYASLPPPVQPIVIYSTPPNMGCGGLHSCQGSHYQHACHISQPRPLLGIAAPVTELTPATAPAPAALPEPRPAPSEISSLSSGSTRSKAMSYKWYTATQPLRM